MFRVNHVNPIMSWLNCFLHSHSETLETVGALLLCWTMACPIQVWQTPSASQFAWFHIHVRTCQSVFHDSIALCIWASIVMCHGTFFPVFWSFCRCVLLAFSQVQHGNERCLIASLPKHLIVFLAQWAYVSMIPAQLGHTFAWTGYPKTWYFKSGKPQTCLFSSTLHEDCFPIPKTPFCQRSELPALGISWAAEAIWTSHKSQLQGQLVHGIPGMAWGSCSRCRVRTTRVTRDRLIRRKWKWDMMGLLEFHGSHAPLVPWDRIPCMEYPLQNAWLGGKKRVSSRSAWHCERKESWLSWRKRCLENPFNLVR